MLVFKMKNAMNNRGQKDNGITLISLIITIIVLLILAGITIATLTGQNSILTNAQRSAEETKKMAALEEVKLAMEEIIIPKKVEGKDITLDIYIEQSEKLNLNLLESKLYDEDKNVEVEPITLEDDEDALNVYYKSYNFIIDGNFQVTIAEDIKKIKVTPTIKSSTISSLTIEANIEEVELSEVTAIYYSCDNGLSWKDSGNNTEYIYSGLLANTDYDVKVKIIINNKKTVISNSIIAKTASLEGIISKIPQDFFTTTETGETITGINASYIVNNEIIYDGFDGTLVIPNKWKNISVISINDSAISKKSNINELYIEEGIKNLDERAFYNCAALTKVTLPTTLESIDVTNIYSSFYECGNITKITIPQIIINDTNTISNVFSGSYTKINEVSYNQDVTYIGKNAFARCSGLKNINVPETVTEIKEGAFSNCTGLTNITIQGNVKTIGKEAFLNCTGLTDLTIKSGVETIGYSAFENCTNLNNLILNEGIKKLDERAFRKCTSLTEVTLPTSLESIDITNIYSSFYECGNITKITIPQIIINDTNTISNVFSGSYTKINEVSYNQDVTYIGKNAFARCSGLKNINVPETVTEIKEGAFSNCTGLTNITIQGNVKTIGKEAFLNCTELTDLTIKSGVETIGYSAFQKCSKLKNLVIEEGVKKLEELAFAECTELTEVTIPSTVQQIDSSNIYSSFYKCTGITKITVKKQQNSISGSPWGASNATVVWDP